MNAALERHFSVNEVSQIWGVHPETVRRMMRREPGVLKLADVRRTVNRQRQRVTLRIPESVLKRAWNKWSK